MNTIILDFETTGLPKAPVLFQPHIIEIGAIYLDDDFNITRTINQIIRPVGEIWDKAANAFRGNLPLKIIKMTGITDDMLVNKPTFQDILPVLAAFFKDADAMIAHNAQFDKQMLEIALERAGCAGFPWPEQIICTMQEYKAVIGGKWPKMSELYEKILQKPLVQKHRAMSDCQDLLEVLTVDNFFEKVKDETTHSEK